MARIETFQRDLQLATAGISPKNVNAALAAFARQELAKAISSGEGSPEYDRYVNGIRDALESTVIAPGPVLYVFKWWQEIATYALQYLIERSPERSGRYKKSWMIMVDGKVVSSPAQIGAASEVVIVNDQPYSRKIEVGHMRMSVPPGVVDDARSAVMRIFGNMVTVKATQILLPNGYILKGVFRRGYRPFARTKLRRDTRAGARMTYPALIMNMKVG